MSVEKRQFATVTKYRAYWRNPYTGKIEKGPSRLTRREAEKDDAEIKIKLKYEPEFFAPADTPLQCKKTVTLAELAVQYLGRPELAESTRKMDYFHFVQVAPSLGEIPAVSLTRENIRDFEEQQRRKGIKQNTVQKRVGLIRAILNWSVDAGIIEENPLRGYRCKRGEDLKLPPPSPQEIGLMLEEAPPHLQRAIILAYYLGVRVGPSELFSLKWEDFDVYRKQMRVWSAKKNKECPWRDIDLVESLCQTMLQWRQEDLEHGITHLISYKGKPVRSIKSAWHSMMKALKEKGKITRRIRPYDLRHAFATEAIAKGADIKAVSVIMGHTDTTMIHRHYQYVLDEQKRSVVEAIPDVLHGVQARGTKGPLSGDFSHPYEKNNQ